MSLGLGLGLTLPERAPTIVSQTLLADGVTIRCVGSVPLTTGDAVGLTRSVGTITSASVVGGNLDIVIPKSYAGDSIGTLTYDGTGTLAGATGAVAAFGPVAITNSSGFGAIFTGASAFWHDFRTGVVPAGYTYSCPSVARRWSRSLQQYVEVAADTFVEDYDPATGECLGYLSEGSATNLCLHSSAPSVPNMWALLRMNASAAGTSLIAGKTAVAVAPSAVNGTHLAYPAPLTVTAGQTYTLNYIVKYIGEWRYVQVQMAAGELCYANFDLMAGTIGTIGNGVSSAVSGNIDALGGGAYLLTLQFTAGTTGTTVAAVAAVQSASSGGGPIFVGDGVSRFEIHHAQFTTGTRVTSPIVTEGSTVNRAATSLFTATIPGWYDPAQVTQFADVRLRQSAVTAPAALCALSVNDNSYSNRIQMALGAGSGAANLYVVSGGAAQASLLVGSALSGTVLFASSSAANSFRFAVGGAAAAEDTSGVMPSGISHVHIGTDHTASHLFGHVRRIGIAPVTQTTAQLQALTS